ncbi:MAG TPA: hypothetical protein P5266_05150, partial [Candidatus Fermentibacter sp.]|nr:hypothetical protein [Candidatus Fermentibacter sp.]
DSTRLELTVIALCLVVADEADPSRVQTNIVIVRTPGIGSDSVVSALGSLGIGCLAMGPESFRIVTHLSLAEKDVRFASDILSAFGG